MLNLIILSKPAMSFCTFYAACKIFCLGVFEIVSIRAAHCCVERMEGRLVSFFHRRKINVFLDFLVTFL
jgi:hypothetical protein